MSISSTLPARRRRGVAGLAAAALAVAGLVATASPALAEAPTTSITPTSAAPNVVASFTVTVQSTPTSTAAQSITIKVPAGFANPSVDSLTGPSNKWIALGPNSGTWLFTSTDPNNDKLNGTEKLVVRFSAITPGVAGSYAWQVGGTVNGSNPIAGFTDPVVTIGQVKQNQTITFANPGPQTYGTGPLSLVASASSGLPVSFTTAADDDCSVSGTSLTLDAAGSCTVTAHQAGNASYNAAADVSRTFAIDKAPQTIVFDAIATQTYGDGPLTLAATGGASGNPVTYTVSADSAGICSVTGTSLSLDGAGDCTVTAHQAGNANYEAAPDASRQFTINKAEAGITLGALNATYDGQPHAATATTSPEGLEDVTITYDGSATAPTDAGSYDVVATLDNPNYTGSAVGTLVIDPKHVTGTVSVDDKTYDGTTNATIDECSVAGIEARDSVTLDCSSATATFDGAGAGAHTATISGAVLTGTGVGNYVLDPIADASGTISKLGITANLQAGDKVYDGNAIASATAVPVGVLSQDVLSVGVVVDSATFSDKNVGTDKTVTATVHLTGSASGNYELASTTLTDQASINALHITATFTADDKTYDGTTSATVHSTDLVGEVAGDDVALTGGTAAFADAAAGAGKTVTLTGATLTGTDAGNYVLDSVADTTATIGKRPVTGSFSVADKIWDGNDVATINGRSLANTVAGDDVSLTGGSATFSSSSVGTWPVAGSGFSLAGVAKDNYELGAVTPNPATAKILPLYIGTGFYAPVNMPSPTIVWNTIKGGQTVPLKFNVKDAYGANQTSLSIFGADATLQAKAFSAQPVSCATGDSTAADAIEVVTTGGTSLRYDGTAGQYIQNWKTPTTVGTCYKVTVRTIDGSLVGPAYFKILK